MRTFIFRKLIVPLLLGLTFYSCTKTEDPDELKGTTASTLTLEQAQNAFQAQTKLAGKQFISKLVPSSTFNLPQWEKALLKSGANKIEYWRIPLKSPDSQRRILYSYDRLTKELKQLQLPSPWLLIYRDSAKQIRVLVQQTIPNTSGYQGGSETMTNSNFSGRVKLYDWSGKLVGGFRYENGKRIKRIIPKNANGDISNA